MHTKGNGILLGCRLHECSRLVCICEDECCMFDTFRRSAPEKETLSSVDVANPQNAFSAARTKIYKLDPFLGTSERHTLLNSVIFNIAVSTL